MGRPAGWITMLTGRPAMRSPGAPSHRREVERKFWIEIAKGLWAEDAAEVVGVSPAVGTRWFRHAGGMSPFERAGLSGRYLSFREREEIALLKAQNGGVREIARRLGRAPSTISRELRRDAATRGGRLDYRASVAQWKAELVAQRPKTAKLVVNDQLRQYVQQRLSGQIRRPDGNAVAGPVTGPVTGPWKGRNKPHRGDRRWVTGWSPEQIAHLLKMDLPTTGNGSVENPTSAVRNFRGRSLPPAHRHRTAHPRRRPLRPRRRHPKPADRHPHRRPGAAPHPIHHPGRHPQNPRPARHRLDQPTPRRRRDIRCLTNSRWSHPS